MLSIKNSHLQLMYFILAISLVIYGFITSTAPQNQIEVSPIGIVEMFFIFIYNFMFMFSLLIVSFTGIPIVYMFTFLISMGESAKTSGIDPLIYYSASFSHGLLEILLSFIIVIYSLKHIQKLWFFIVKKEDTKKLIDFYQNTLLKVVPLIAAICLIAAILEVYVSNPLIRYFVN